MLFDYNGLYSNNVLALQKHCRAANAATTVTQRDKNSKKHVRNEHIQINV